MSTKKLDLPRYLLLNGYYITVKKIYKNVLTIKIKNRF